MEKEFWEQRWIDQQTGWDIGYASPAIVDYFNNIENNDIKILIPGCGNAYEAEAIYQMGFHNVWIIDIAEQAIESFKKRCPEFPADQIIHGDFFTSSDLDQLQPFDRIVEQTFFCAIHPSKRDEYCERMQTLLGANAVLIGLMFDFPLETGPPFGGSKKEYIDRFSACFDDVQIAPCIHSIPPRAGREFWIEIAKPKVK